MTITREELTEWKKTAEAAKKGKWFFSPWHIEEGSPAVRHGSPYGYIIATTDVDSNASHIANASPENFLRLIAALEAVMDGTKVVVPVEPTEAMWGNDLVRWIVRWMGEQDPTPKSLLLTLKSGYGEPPQWLLDQVEMKNDNHVVSKGTRAYILYRAMIAAHNPTTSEVKS